MGQHWHVCSTTYGSPYTMCMETVVTEYQLVPPYYGTPQTEPGTPNNSRERMYYDNTNTNNIRKKKVIRQFSIGRYLFSELLLTFVKWIEDFPGCTFTPNVSSLAHYILLRSVHDMFEQIYYITKQVQRMQIRLLPNYCSSLSNGKRTLLDASSC